MKNLADNNKVECYWCRGQYPMKKGTGLIDHKFGGFICSIKQIIRKIKKWGIFLSFVLIAFEEEGGEAIPRICDQKECLATYYSLDCKDCPYNECDYGVCPTTKEGFSFCWLTTSDKIISYEQGHWKINKEKWMLQI